MQHKTKEEIEQGLPEVLNSPINNGTLEMIVIRPEVEEREVLNNGVLNIEEGLVGDNWKKRTGETTEKDTQITIMNARLIALLAQEKKRWALAGDQLYVDLDLSEDNVPEGTQIAIGEEAVVVVTAVPHLGCRKFIERFGKDAMIFVNSEIGKALHLRGIYAKVIKPGKIKKGDAVELIHF
ncbi:MAG: hypothetical protein OEX22_07895 [Cyclobacteriaceae bacterium]|nr:hypothetical protein [Cyclobacteriaceae bacterium]